MDIKSAASTKTNGSFTLHGTGNGTGTRNGTGNDGFMYFAMYCSHYTGTGTGEFFTVCTKLAEMAILYSKNLTTAKNKLAPVGLDLVQEILLV